MNTDLRGEILALLDEDVPAHDLGLCFSYSIFEEPYHTRLEKVTTYEEIYKVLDELGVEISI